MQLKQTENIKIYINKLEFIGQESKFQMVGVTELKYRENENEKIR